LRTNKLFPKKKTTQNEGTPDSYRDDNPAVGGAGKLQKRGRQPKLSFSLSPISARNEARRGSQAKMLSVVVLEKPQINNNHYHFMNLSSYNTFK
jgi:hypothetical protein